jgi:kumamolisin
MNFSTTVIIDNSSGVITEDVQSTIASDVNQQITIKLLIRRPESVSDYADQILNGTASPLSRDEFSKRFSSSDEDIALVCEFAEHYNFTVDKSHADSATITLIGTIGSFNNAFGVTLNEITNSKKTYRSHSGELSIPAELKDIIIHVSGHDNYLEGALQPMLTGYHLDQNGNIPAEMRPAAAIAGSVPLTPTQVATAYNFPKSDGYGQTVAILQFGGGYTQNNLISTFTDQGFTIPDITVVELLGATNSPDTGPGSAETMLDTFVVGVVAPRAKQVIYFAPNNNAFLSDVFNAALYDTDNAPSVISVSWGYIEDGWLIFYPGYIAGINDTLASAAVLGVTITNSSGDYGSIPFDYGVAYANTVSMIASSPYVLGCGGTSLLLHANNVTKTEVVWNHDGTGSGGGKSKLWGTPTYQQGRRIRNWRINVTGILQTLNAAGISSTTSSANNINVRGVPDVAGNADGSTGYTFFYGIDNSGIQAGGTSAVSPLWAGLVARLNQLSGKRMGFMNPMLYINTHIFRDITSGNNVVLYGVGYGANTGWDACTGLGTPRGNALYQLVRTGYVYPKSNYGFRTRTSSSYPRITRR